jgi:hypothetical protein
MPPFDMEDYRELRQCLLSFVQGCGDPIRRRWWHRWFRRRAFYRCRYCFGTGPWPSEIAHGNHTGDGHGRPCRVVRARRLLDGLLAWIETQETRAADSPVVGGN